MTQHRNFAMKVFRWWSCKFGRTRPGPSSSRSRPHRLGPLGGGGAKHVMDTSHTCVYCIRVAVSGWVFFVRSYFRCRPPARIRKHIVDWLQSLFADKMATWCMPLDVWRVATTLQESRHDNLSEEGLARHVAELVRSPPEWRETGPCVFFRVANPNVGALKVQRPAHQEWNKCSASVVRLKVLCTDSAEGVCEVEQDTAASVDIDLLALAADGRYHLLFRWEAMHSLSTLSLAPCVAEVVVSTSVTLGRDLAKPALAIAQAMCFDGAWTTGRKTVSLSVESLAAAAGPDVDASAVQVLQDCGAIAVTQNELLEPEGALHPWAVTWSNCTVCAAPSAAFSCGAGGDCKLGMVALLVGSGWTIEPGDLERFTMGGDRIFPDNVLRRSKACLRCLLAVHALAAKGAQAVLFGMPEGYYLCLLGLRNVRAMQEHAALRRLRHGDFMAHLKGAALPADPGPLSGAMLDAAEGEGEGGDVAPILDLDMAAVGAIPPRSAPSAPPKVRCGQVAIRFDSASHRSGVQRGYVVCHALGHVSCHKYRQIDQFENWQDCAAWLAAWAIHGASECDKVDHLGFEPWPAQVAEQLELLVS